LNKNLAVSEFGVGGVLELRYYVRLACHGKDFSEFNGANLLAWKENSSLATCPDLQVMMQTAANYELNGEVLGAPFKSSGSSISYTGQPNLQSCRRVFNGQNYQYGDSCIHIHRQVHDTSTWNGKPGDDDGTETYVRLKSTALVETPIGEPVFYQAGSYNIEIGAWTGAVRYCGADCRPTWTLKNETTTESGLLGESPVSDDDAFRLHPGSAAYLKSARVLQRVELLSVSAWGLGE
jgi:hypothetical protein